MSNFWVICGLALLCLVSVKCSRYFPEEDEYFLDKTKYSEKVQTEKQEDTEWDLNDAGKLWKEINDVRELFAPSGEVETDNPPTSTDKVESTTEGNGNGDDKEINPNEVTDDNTTDEDDNTIDEDEKNKCDTFGCQNGGTCKVEKDELRCICPTQFTGDKCEINKCDTFGCQNGGTCKVDQNELRCICPTQFTGDKCEINKCDTFGCQNGGTCKVEKNELRCICPTQFNGDKCEIKACTTLNCTGHGICQEKVGVEKCVCYEGYSGDNCEEVDFCPVKCGVDPDVECIGDKTKKTNITCECIETEQLFDPNTKTCKNDNCKEKCDISYNDKNKDLKCEGGPFGDVKCICRNSSLDFDSSDKTCKVDYCKKICGTLQCRDGDKFDKDEIECICRKPEYEEFDKEKGKCRINYCKKVCGSAAGVKCTADDKYKLIQEKNCTCEDDDYVFNKKECKRKCTEDKECQNEAKCSGLKEKMYCDCKTGTTGDYCETVKDCQEGGKYQKCETSGGKCAFKNGKSTCECSGDKKLYEKLGYCEVTCTKTEDCKASNRMCNDRFCVCKDGYEGDDCSKVKGCNTLEANCTKIGKKCIFDEKAENKAKCECDDGYTYDPKVNECKHAFCHPNNTCKGANCTYDESTGIGYCKCLENQYYNYKKQICEDLPDKCLMKKVPCRENYECVKGKCVCKDKTIKEGEECKPKLCEKGSCFKNAKCSEEDGSCYCEVTEYFKGKVCNDAKCSFKDFKKNCTCPADTTRKENGECDAPEGKTCTKDCGYGVCFKNKEKDICKCFHFGTKNENGTCILNKNYCQGAKLQEEDPMKCKCELQYTQADDGITCRPKTCKDEDAKTDCAKKGAVCVTKKLKDGYDCKCPIGYVLGETDGNKKCMEPCSMEENIRKCAKNGELCFNSLSKSEGYTCSCPPTLTKDDKGKCSTNAENGYLISNIFVLKKKYEINGQINTAILNDHLKESLEQTFSGFQNGYVYDFRISEDALNCSVWVNFNKAPEKIDLDKIKLTAKTLSGDCEDCYENAILWPPHLLLSSEGLKNAESSKLKFCSEEVKDIFCGKETKCESNRCSCKNGFKIIQNSVQEIGGNKVLRCEDIDECAKGIHACSANTECVNTFGSYKCVCKEGYKKKETPANPETDKSPCYDMCSPSPCGKGKCVLQGKTFDCECDAGYGGSFCSRADVNYASAKKGTVIVGAVLGTLLILGTIAVLYYIIKVRKRSGSEDFMPAGRMDRAEMTERRPVRGVTNRAYE